MHHTRGERMSRPANEVACVLSKQRRTDGRIDLFAQANAPLMEVAFSSFGHFDAPRTYGNRQSFTYCVDRDRVQSSYNLSTDLA